eukprot:scaffold64583_cov48-Phaeocystis_antarctica.AAC.3
MRAVVLSARGGGAWGGWFRSVAELKEAATHYERVAAMQSAPVMKAKCVELAELCRRNAASIMLAM